MPIYGIDLGTTNSVIGCNGQLSPIVPSIANFFRDVAGYPAKSFAESIRNYKVDMQTSEEGAVAVDASALVLRALKRSFNIPDNQYIDAVISVPAYFGADQCKATREAAEFANINVRSMIKEPTAAAIFLKKSKDGTAVVFDLGGGTLDVSVIQVINGNARVLSTDGCVLGGRDLDTALGDFIQRKYGLPVIRIDACYYDYISDVKVLAAQTDGDVLCLLPPNLQTSDGKRMITVTHSEYTELVHKVFGKALDIAKIAISASKVNISEMEFFFVGGSTHCPVLRQMVEEGLGIKASKEEYDRDLAVANGAVYYAQLLSEGKVSDKVHDVSKYLGLAINNGALTHTIMPKNTGLPVTVTSCVALGTDKSYKLKLLYGDYNINVPLAENNNMIVAEFPFSFTEKPNSEVDSLIKITASLNEAGLLIVELCEPLCEPVRIEQEIIL